MVQKGVFESGQTHAHTKNEKKNLLITLSMIWVYGGRKRVVLDVHRVKTCEP